MNNGFVVRRVSGVYYVAFSNIWGLVNQALGTKVKKRTLKGEPQLMVIHWFSLRPTSFKESQLAGGKPVGSILGSLSNDNGNGYDDVSKE